MRRPSCMNEYRVEQKLFELYAGMKDLKNGVAAISNKVNPNDELWDNSDIIKKWNVSQRTLASWRSKQLIDYVKVGKKIYYSKEDRDRFLSKFHCKSLEG